MASASAHQPDPRRKATGKKKQRAAPPKVSPALVTAVLDAHGSVVEALEHDDGTAHADQRLLSAGHDAVRALRTLTQDAALWAALEAGATQRHDVEVLATYAREGLPWLLEKAKYRPPPTAEELVHEALGALREAQDAPADERRSRLIQARANLISLTTRTQGVMRTYAMTANPRRRPGRNLRRVLVGLVGLTGAVGGALLGLGGVELAQAAFDPSLSTAGEKGLEAAGQFAGMTLGTVVDRRLRGSAGTPGLSAEVEVLRAELEALTEAAGEAPPDTAVVRARALATRLGGHDAREAATAVTEAAKARLAGDRDAAAEHVHEARVAVTHVFEKLFGEARRKRGG